MAAVLLMFAAEPARGAEADLEAVRARADRGDPEALNTLGNAYANGQGMPQSYPEALRLYQRAADRGSAAASFNLGMLTELGRGTAANPEAAFRYYLKAGQQGFAPAQFNLGNMYANGIGVRQDAVEASVWFQQAADRGIPEAQYNLALAYEVGRGVLKDEAAAQKWYRAAAGQGYARARYNLALMLEEGRGSAVDLPAAAELYRAAGAQGFASAQNNLGILLAEGRGVPQNMVEAHAWFSLAVENGAKPTGRDIVAQRLSPAQVEESKTVLATLRNQLASGTVPPPVASSPAATPTTAVQPVAETGALDAKLSALQTELSAARHENTQLTEQVVELGKQRSAMEERLAVVTSAADAAKADIAAREKLAADLAATQKALAEAKANANQLANDNARLRTLAETPSPAESNASALRTQVEQLTRYKQAADKRVQELAAKTESVPASQNPATSGAPAEAVTAMSLDQLAAADARIATLIAERNRLSEELKQAALRLTQLTRQPRLQNESPSDAGVATMERRLAELHHQLEILQTANLKLVAENNDRKAAAADQERMRQENARPKSSAPASTPALEDRIKQAEQSATEAVKQRDALAADKAALEKQLAEMKNPANEGELRRQLDATVTDLGKANQAATDLRVELEKTKQLLEAEKKRVSEAAAVKSASADSDQQHAIEAANQKLAAIQAERDQLAQQLSERQKTAAIPQKDSVAEAKIAELTQQLQDQRTALGQEKSAFEHRATEQQTQVDTLEQANAKLTSDLEAAKADRQKLATANDQSLAAQAKAIQAQEAATEAKKQSETLAQERNTLRERLAESASQLSAQQIAGQKLEQDKAALTDRITALEAEQNRLGEAGKRTASLETTLKQAQQAATDASNARTALQAEKTAALEAQKRLEAANADLTTRLNAVTAERDRLVATAPAGSTDKPAQDRLTEQLETANRTIAELNDKNDSLQKDLEVSKQSTAAALAAQVAAIKAAPTDAMKLELQALQDQVRMLESQAESERKTSAQELTALAGQLQNSRESNRALSDANRALTQAKGAEDASGRAVADGLKNQLADAQADLEKAKNDLAALQAKYSDASRAADQHNASVAELTGVNDKLSTDKAALEKDVAQLRQTLESARAEANALKKRASSSDQVAQEQQANVTELTAANEKLQAQLKELTAQVASLRSDNSRLAGSSDAVTAVRAELADTKSKLAEAQKAAAQYNAAVGELTGANDKLATDKAALEKEVAQVRQSSEGGRTELAALRKRAASAEQVLQDQLANINELNAANEKLQAQLKDVNGQLAGVKADNARLAGSSDSIASVKAELADTKAKLAEAQRASGQYSASVAELTEANDKLSTEKAALEKDLTQIRQSTDNGRLELVALRKRTVASDQVAQEQLASLNELTAANDKLQNQVRELGAQLTALRTDNGRLAGSSDALRSARAELADTKNRLAEALRVSDQHAGTVGEITAANDKLTTDLKDAQTELTALRAERSRLVQIDQARQSAEQRIAQLSAAASQLPLTQRELASARSEISRLSETVQALDRDRTVRVTQLQQENAAISARLRQAQGTLDQIASAARLLNGGNGAASPSVPVIPLSAPTPPTSPTRVHLVSEGDSLTRISLRYYGTANRWQDIYDANRELLKGENALRPGQRLRIP